MAIDVETETTIARPRTEVAGYASEPGNAPAWYANIDNAEWLTPRPLALGSRFAFALHSSDVGFPTSTRSSTTSRASVS